MQPDEPRAATTRAYTRLRATAAQLGFLPPPVTLRLKLLQSSRCWSLFLQPAGESRIGPLVEWLEPWSPLRIEFGSRKVLRADFDPLPAEWLARFRSLEVEMLVLYADGSALATVAGPHAALATFARTVSSPTVRVTKVADSPRDVPLLTQAQDAALRAAIAAGYYKIPRPLTLQKLAAQMGIAPASLSERLRRAEGRVLTRYAQEGATTPWDARTIFDAHPVEDPPLLAPGGPQTSVDA